MEKGGVEGLEMDKDRRKIITAIYVTRRNVSKLVSNFHGETYNRKERMKKEKKNGKRRNNKETRIK